MWTARSLLFQKSRERALVHYLVCNRHRWTRTLCSPSLSKLKVRHPAILGSRSSNLDGLSNMSTFILYRSCGTRTEAENRDRIKEAKSNISEVAVGLETLLGDAEGLSLEKTMLKQYTRYNISSLVKRGEIGKTYMFFENMRRDVVHPDEIIFNAFLSRTSPGINYRTLVTSIKPKKLSGAKQSDYHFLENNGMEFKGDGTKTLPRQRSYIRKDNIKWQRSPWKVKQLRFARQIMNLVRKGKVSEAHEVFEQMKKGKVHPDVAVFNTLIAGYGREGDAKSGFKLFNEVHCTYMYVRLY